MKYTGVKETRQFVRRVIANDHSTELPMSTGHFSRVWDMGDKVLKISGYPGWGGGESPTGEDQSRCDGWRWFAAYCVAHPCRFFPTFHHFELMPSEVHAWAVMDKLYHIPNVPWGAIDHAGDRRDSRLQRWRRRCEHALAYKGDKEWITAEFKVLPVWLRDLAAAVRAERDRHDEEKCLAVDLHDANIMQDWRGHRVLNDPFGFSV